MKDEITVYLCDDDCNFITKTEQSLKTILESKQRDYEILTFTDGENLTETFKHYFADVVFLDIDMPLMDGFETAEALQRIKSDVNIVFITNHEDKVFQSYEYHPFWFVRKSHMEDLGIVLSKLLIKVDTIRKRDQKIFNLVTEAKIVGVDIYNVQYIQAQDHYIFIKSTNDNGTLVRGKISDAESQLLPLHFVRVQNSIIVNCRFIERINSRYVTLIGGKKINISRDKVEFVKNEYQKYIRSI